MAKKIVTIGGGSGQFALLQALKNIENIDITAVVAMSDSGGSTGVLRDQFGELPPGDVLKCLIALSPLAHARDLLQTRFSEGKLKDHNAGNLLLVFLSQYLNRDFPAAIRAMAEILQIKGQVLPVTTDKTTLVAELENGKFLFGETVIDIVKGGTRSKIKRTFLVPHAAKLEVYRPVLQAITQADYIFIGPGDFYTSITPNLLVEGVVQSLTNTQAKIVYILNLMTKFGETDSFTASQFVQEVEKFVRVDLVVANDAPLSRELIESYKAEQAEPVLIDDSELWQDCQLLTFDLLTAGEIVRHDPIKLQKAIEAILA